MNTSTLPFPPSLCHPTKICRCVCARKHDFLNITCRKSKDKTINRSRRLYKLWNRIGKAEPSVRRTSNQAQHWRTLKAKVIVPSYGKTVAKMANKNTLENKYFGPENVSEGKQHRELETKVIPNNVGQTAEKHKFGPMSQKLSQPSHSKCVLLHHSKAWPHVTRKAQHQSDPTSSTTLFCRQTFYYGQYLYPLA